MKNPYFGRLLTAMVTPFTKDGVNLKATADLADWLVKKGNDGLVVPCMSDTMARSSCSRAFRRVDLPTLGAPMMATGMPLRMGTRGCRKTEKGLHTRS